MTINKNSKAWNITIWIFQAVVAILMFMPAFMKLTKPISELSALWKWTGEFPEALVRLLGVLDLLGCIGIILPSLVKIKPGLTPIVAVGIVLLMICATVFHISRGESDVIGFNIILVLLAGFVAWGRFETLSLGTRKSQ